MLFKLDSTVLRASVSRTEKTEKWFLTCGCKSMEWDSQVLVRNLNKKMFKQKLHLTVINILKESDSYLNFQQIFQHIQNYQFF